MSGGTGLVSGGTGLDVWQYIAREDLEIPSIYFAHQRRVFERDGMLAGRQPCISRTEDETVYEAVVRYRTVGDM